MGQYSLFGHSVKEIVNVAKVPHRSPFRYPGGKTWLVPQIRNWLESLDFMPSKFIEPFAGGAIVGLTVAFERYAENVLLVEIDEQVAAVWKTILCNNGKWLAEKISNFNLTEESAREIILQKSKSTRALAFQTLLKNRIYHGGILANGSGMSKFGENGKGIFSRWYPETIKNRILRINEIKQRIEFIQGDGLEVLKKFSSHPKAVFFIDPPYTAGGKKAGKRLYKYFDVDHDEIFRIASQIKGECLLTYDDSFEVRNLAEKYGFHCRQIAMQNTHLSSMKELIISKNLSWAK